MNELNYSINPPPEPLSMWRIFYQDGIEFKYIMYNVNTGKYNIVNFTKNLIEPGEYNSEQEVIDRFNELQKAKLILEYQKI